MESARLKRVMSRSRHAAIGAGIGAAIGGLFSTNAASTGGALGALVGATVGEKRAASLPSLKDVVEKRSEES